jgi:hypothetical protein
MAARKQVFLSQTHGSPLTVLRFPAVIAQEIAPALSLSSQLRLVAIGGIASALPPCRGARLLVSHLLWSAVSLPFLCSGQGIVALQTSTPEVEVPYLANVRFVPKADMAGCPRHVRVTSDALLYEQQYRVRQVEKQRSAEKANHAAQRQIKALTGACNLTLAIDVLRGLNKALAGDHDNSDTERDESQAGGISKGAAMRSDLLLRSKWRGVSQE